MRERLQIASATLVTLPWLLSLALSVEHPHEVEALLSGIAVVGAAFLVSWAAETAEVDVPRSFSLAIVALLAILPEYAVDAYFAWMAGRVGGEYVHYATANMTGANRLLIGVGWSLVAVIAMLKLKKSEVGLDEGINLETFFLLAATLYSFKIPLTGRIDLFDSLVLVMIYLLYISSAVKAEREEFEPVGVPAYLCRMDAAKRRVTVVAMFTFAALTIFLSVEAFAEGLIATAKKFGIDEFLAVQWIAPLASEAPEFIVAAYLVSRLRVTAGMTALISSKVNQWTLLIGTIAIVFSIASFALHPLPLDARQREEVLLTAAQSLFGLAVILDRRINTSEVALLLSLFAAQFVLQGVWVRYILTAVYLALALPILIKKRRHIAEVVRYATSHFRSR